jgi:hypothetical protein
MAKEPEPPKPIRWSIYKIAAKAVRLGTVEAPDAATAIERVAEQFKTTAQFPIDRITFPAAGGKQPAWPTAFWRAVAKASAADVPVS